MYGMSVKMQDFNQCESCNLGHRSADEPCIFHFIISIIAFS